MVSHELVREIKKKHDEISKKMVDFTNSMITEKWEYDKRKVQENHIGKLAVWKLHQQENSNAPKPATLKVEETSPKYTSSSIPFKALEKGKVPQHIIDYLKHDDVLQLEKDSIKRNKITKELKKSLNKLEKDPHANKQEVVTLLNKLKEAEDNIAAGYPYEKESCYQEGYYRTGAVVEIINSLFDQDKLEKTEELENAKQVLRGIREYCRVANQRHATWFDYRKELKQLVGELADELGVEVDPKLLKTPEPMQTVYSINAKHKVIRSRAKELLSQS